MQKQVCLFQTMSDKVLRHLAVKFDFLRLGNISPPFPQNNHVDFSIFFFFFFLLNYLNTTYNTKQLQMLLKVLQFTSPTLQINVITYSTYNPIYTLLTKIIRYLHPYCNNEQQNRDNSITH